MTCQPHACPRSGIVNATLRSCCHMLGQNGFQPPYRVLRHARPLPAHPKVIRPGIHLENQGRCTGTRPMLSTATAAAPLCIGWPWLQRAAYNRRRTILLLPPLLLLLLLCRTVSVRAPSVLLHTLQQSFLLAILVLHSWNCGHSHR